MVTRCRPRPATRANGCSAGVEASASRRELRWPSVPPDIPGMFRACPSAPDRHARGAIGRMISHIGPSGEPEAPHGLIALPTATISATACVCIVLDRPDQRHVLWPRPAPVGSPRTLAFGAVRLGGPGPADAPARRGRGGGPLPGLTHRGRPQDAPGSLRPPGTPRRLGWAAQRPLRRAARAGARHPRRAPRRQRSVASSAPWNST